MCSPNSIKHKSLGRLNSMRRMNSTLKRSAVVVLGGLVAFRPVPSIGEWIFCLLLLRDSEAAIRDGSDVVVGDTSTMPLRSGDQQQKHRICLVVQGSG